MSDENVTLPDEPDEPTEVRDATTEEPAPAAETAPEPPPPPTCAECGTELEDGQAYCMECGAPTPAAPSLKRRIGPAGVLALGLLALGGGAGALAYAIAKDDEDTARIPSATTLSIPTIGTDGFTTDTGSVDSTTSIPSTSTGLPIFPSTASTSPFPSTDTITTIPGTDSTTGTITIPDPSTETISPSTQSTPSTSTFTPSTTTQTTPGTTAGDTWPDGTDGWTVILSSTSDRAAAARFRDQVVASGRSAGLIDSSLYTTLEPGLWVVYSGVLTSRSAAVSSAATLRSAYPGAYAAEVTGG